jgi:hypothetical protein
MAQTLVFCVLFCKSLFVIVFLFFCQLYWLSFYFGILWSLYWLFFLDLQLLIASLVSYGHCIVCSSIYSYWLPLWYLMVIVLAVLLRFTATDCLFGILWSLYWLFFFDLQLLIAPLVSYGHCIGCFSSIYSYWLPLWYLMVIVLAVLLRFTATDCLFGILWSLYWLSLDIRLLIASLVSYGHCIVCSFLDLQLLIASLVSYGHCIGCPSSIYSYWLPLWYLQIFLQTLNFSKLTCIMHGAIAT